MRRSGIGHPRPSPRRPAPRPHCHPRCPPDAPRGQTEQVSVNAIKDLLDVAGIPGDIPEKYFVTVSGFPPEQNDSFSNSSREFVGSVPQGGGGGGKPRNITEV